MHYQNLRNRQKNTTGKVLIYAVYDNHLKFLSYIKYIKKFTISATDLQDIHTYEFRSTDDNVEELYSYASTDNLKIGSDDIKTTRNVDDEMLQRLRKLEEFQKNFLNQQRLALADLAALVMAPSSAKAECIEGVNTISSLPKKMANEESVNDNALVNVRDLISSFEQQSLSDFEEYKKYHLNNNTPLTKQPGKYSIVSEKSHIETATDNQGTILTSITPCHPIVQCVSTLFYPLTCPL